MYCTDPYPLPQYETDNLFTDFCKVHDTHDSQQFLINTKHYYNNNHHSLTSRSCVGGVDHDHDDNDMIDDNDVENDCCSGLDPSGIEIIPKQNQKLRSLLDRIFLEVQKFQRKS